MRSEYLSHLDISNAENIETNQLPTLKNIQYDSERDGYTATSDLSDKTQTPTLYHVNITGPNGETSIQQEALDLPKFNNAVSVIPDPYGDGYWISTAEKQNRSYHISNHTGNASATVAIQSENQNNATNITTLPDGSYYLLKEQDSTDNQTNNQSTLSLLYYTAQHQLVGEYLYQPEQSNDDPTITNSVSSIAATPNHQLFVLEKVQTTHSSSAGQVFQLDLTNSDDKTAVTKNTVLTSPSLVSANNSEAPQANGNIVAMTLSQPLQDNTPTLAIATSNSTESDQAAQISTYYIPENIGTDLTTSYITQADLPTNETFTDPTSGITYQIGGLSGIDYNPATNTYLVVTDHLPGGSSIAFEIKLDGMLDSTSTPQVTFLKAIPLNHADGTPVYDGESIRYDPNGDGFWVTTEEKIPGIYHYHSDGSVTNFTVPESIASRIQNNLSLEGATFTPDGSLYVSTERNLINDATGYSRILKFSPDGTLVAQYAYYTDRPSSIGANNNGISEILAVDNNRLLVMERGHNRSIPGSSNQAASFVRIYEIDLTNAQDISNLDVLTTTNTTTVPKKVIFNSTDPSIVNELNTPQTKIDNLEGMTWGPNLPDGRKSLILVTDNNFNADQNKTQFLTLAVDDGNPCYLTGTLIRTEHGMTKVEDIQVGDMVYAYKNEEWLLEKVIWVGQQHATIYPNQYDDFAGYPICIRKHALGNNMPFADLYITAEHCLFFSNCFVPARMLVNNKSIFYDHSVTDYDYYHIETEAHTIIQANGILSESFLNTGNRHYFANNLITEVTSNTPKSWSNDAAAPLVVDRQTVEPIFQYLDNRADLMELPSTQAEKTLTDHPDLYVLTENGEKIYPTSSENSYFSFQLPQNTNSIRLKSRTNRHCDTQGPFIDDRTIFGVLVDDIIIQENNQQTVLHPHLEHQKLSGWLPLSNSQSRWTNGNALVPLQSKLTEHPVTISFHIVQSGPYLIS